MARKFERSFNRTSVQGRNMFVMTYCPEYFIKEVLSIHSTSIIAWSYIYHDKFSDSELGDKERKEPHYHILIRLSRSFTESAVSKWFTFYNNDGLKQRVDCRRSDEVYADFEYLIHKNHPDKYQFLPSERVTYNPSKFNRKTDKTSDCNAINALEDMLAGKNIYTIALKYGRDVIYHMPQLKYTYDLIVHGTQDAYYREGGDLKYFNMIYNDFDEKEVKSND